jgi:hypothetical protein
VKRNNAGGWVRTAWTSAASAAQAGRGYRSPDKGEAEQRRRLGPHGLDFRGVGG